MSDDDYGIDFKQIALDAARHARDHMFQEHRGAMRWRGNAAIFGNDGYESENTKAEVDILRQLLEERGIMELGFAVEDEGYTWAMIVADDNLDLLKGLVIGAWEAGYGVAPHDPLHRQFKKAQGLDDVDRDGNPA